jgi:hypothetical protein
LRRRLLLADNTHPNEYRIDGEYWHDGQWHITVWTPSSTDDDRDARRPVSGNVHEPLQASHTGIDINTITGGRFLSPGTGIVTNIELNTGNGLPGGSNYGIRIHLTSTGLYAWYHFEVNGSISDQTQRDNILVTLGDRVTAGQHIGNLVALGQNAHVHFDMLDAGGRDAVRCPLVYFSPTVATAWESLYDATILARTSKLPDLCNEVDVPNP